MNINPMFVTIVAVDHLSIDNTKLENYCRQQINSFEKEKGIGIAQSTFLNLYDEELKELIDAVTDRVNALHKELGFDVNYEQVIQKTWANINNSESIDFPHCHQGAFFNAVYYIKADPSNADLVLMSPVQEIEHVIKRELVTHTNSFNCSWQLIKPETGMLVIMPGWLKHFVKQDKSANDRISIALDYVMSPISTVRSVG